jgi:hypothetical protein
MEQKGTFTILHAPVVTFITRAGVVLVFRFHISVHLLIRCFQHQILNFRPDRPLSKLSKRLHNPAPILQNLKFKKAQNTAQTITFPRLLLTQTIHFPSPYFLRFPALYFASGPPLLEAKVVTA